MVRSLPRVCVSSCLVGAFACLGDPTAAEERPAFAQATPSAPDAASAAEAPPDKSRYWLFNPTPTELMRSFSTDRPTKSNVPYTVDAGHFQYEVDGFNWLYDHWNNGRTTTNVYLFTNPVLKVGLTNYADFEVNFIPQEKVRATDRTTGRTSDTTGFGDILTRVKVNLWGNEGGSSAAALIPFAKWPTAEAGLGGNNQVEGGVIAPLSFALPYDVTLLFNTEFDSLKNAGGNGRHANFINLVNVSRTFFETVTVYAELWSDVNKDPLNTTKQLTFDTAVAWLVAPNLQLDIGANVGLNKDAPDFQAYVGIAQRF